MKENLFLKYEKLRNEVHRHDYYRPRSDDRQASWRTEADQLNAQLEDLRQKLIDRNYI